MSRPASSARRAKRTPTSFAASFVRRGEQWTANVRQVSDELLAMNVQHPNSYRTGPDERGHFGIYGGRFVAETLMPLILDLERAYADAKADPKFRNEMDGHLANYVGRPSPLYLAERMTEHLRGLAAAGGGSGGAKIYLKREA